MPCIHFLTELYYPEQTSTGYILTHLAEGLAKEYSVKVITGPATNFFESQNCPQHEIKNDVEIFRCGGTKFNKNKVLGRIFNIVTRSLNIFVKCLQQCNSSDIILVVTNPPTLPLLAILINKIKGNKCVLIIHDVYPDVLEVADIGFSFKPISFFLEYFNKILYKKSSQIIVLGRDMMQKIKNKESLTVEDESKVLCIPNWAETNSIYPTEKYENLLVQDLNLKDKFIILYAGNLGRTHGVEDIGFVAQAFKNIETLHFLIIGSGQKKTWLENYIRYNALTNITVIPLEKRPRSEQNISLNACDVAIISFLPGMAGISVPSRMYNHMAAGKPIIGVTDDWSELAQVIIEENIGWVVKPGDIDALVETIKFAANHPDLCQEMGSRASQVALSKYTFSQSLQSYKDVLNNLLSEK